MKRIALIALLVTAGRAAAQDTTEAAEAARTFRGQCLTCHQPPDLNLATDRAWLDQVHRTA